MEVQILTSAGDLERYTSWVRAHPQGTLWQSIEWKKFQESLGREVRIYVGIEHGKIVASALVVIDTTALGLATWEIPRGPIGTGDLELGTGKEHMGALMQKIIFDAKQSKCIMLFLSPKSQVASSKFHSSYRHIHPEATRILDLTLTDDQLLSQMKPKGRYNIGLAQKHGVYVEISNDIGAYTELAQMTAHRDRFRGHSAKHYEAFLDSLPGSFLMLAYLSEESHTMQCCPDGQKMPHDTHNAPPSPTSTLPPIAGLMGVIWGSTGIYYYGASSDAARHVMAPYLLQWEAMQHCRRSGCTRYDLFGIAPEGSTDHPWSGVSEFKAKFGGEVVTYPPEQEVVLRPGLKTLLSWKRKFLG